MEHNLKTFCDQLRLSNVCSYCNKHSLVAEAFYNSMWVTLKKDTTQLYPKEFVEKCFVFTTANNHVPHSLTTLYIASFYVAGFCR